MAPGPGLAANPANWNLPRMDRWDDARCIHHPRPRRIGAPSSFQPIERVMSGGAGLMSLAQGFLLGASICMTLGPQSAFVLRQGVARQNAFSVAMICTLADLLLIAMAAAGASIIVQHFPAAIGIGVWGGALFTLIFGCIALLAAAKPKTVSIEVALPRRIIATAFVLCFLNPQVYFEMVALVGGVALQFAPAERATFAVGVALVSPLWFFGLAVGGTRLAPFFSRPRAHAALDFVTGLALVAVAVSMIANQLQA